MLVAQFSNPEQQLDSLRSVAFEKPMLTDDQAKEVEDWLGLGEGSSSSQREFHQYYLLYLLCCFFQKPRRYPKRRRRTTDCDQQQYSTVTSGMPSKSMFGFILSYLRILLLISTYGQNNLFIFAGAIPSQSIMFQYYSAA